MTALKYGRLPAKAVALGDLTHYLTEPLPTPPLVVEAPDLVYPMADNDRLGCCTIAGVVHTDQAMAALTDEPWTYPGDDAVEQTYFGLTGGADTGLVETDVLRQWSTAGLFGHKLAAFAPLAVKHTVAIRQSIALCGVVYAGVLVPEPAQRQFATKQAWALTGTPADSQIDGGHAIPLVGYNATGPVCVTWGALQQITWGWWLTYADESYAAITAEVKERGQLRGVNFAALEADLSALEQA